MLIYTIARVMIVLVFGFHSVNAAQYRLEPELNITMQQDDNINVSVDNPISLNGVSVSPSINLHLSTPTWTHSIDTTLTHSTFNRSQYNSDDQLIELLTQKKGERYIASVSSVITRDSTRTSEELDSGRISASRREHYSATAFWSYKLGYRNIVSTSVTASAVDYQSTRYTGNTNWQTYSELSHALSENLQVFVRANASEYRSDDQTGSFTFIQLFGGIFPIINQREQTYATNTSEYGLQLGANYQITEKLSLFALAGNNETETTYDINDTSRLCINTANNPSFIVRGVCDLSNQETSAKLVQINGSWEQERQKVSANYYIRNQPSSDGYLIKSERFAINWNYQLSRRSDVKISGIWGKHESLNKRSDGIDRSISNRDYLSLNVFFNYRLSENWIFNSGYKYRNQDRIVNDGDAESNVIQLGISYKPKKLQWSR